MRPELARAVRLQSNSFGSKQRACAAENRLLVTSEKPAGYLLFFRAQSAASATAPTC